MIRVGIIGLGNTGNQVASLGLKELNVPVLAINSSDRDLETVPAGVPKLKLSTANGLSQGAGKDRNLAKTFLKDSIRGIVTPNSEIATMLNELDTVFIVSSTGGGTGSGTAPILASIVSQMFPDVRVILVGVLPVLSEALSAQVNSLQYLDELYKSLKLPYMLYDNDRCKDMPSYQMMETVNKEIIEDIRVMRGEYNLSTRYDSIDEKDLNRISAFPGRIVVARLQNFKESDVDNTTIEDMIIGKLKSNCHAELQRDKKVAASGIITNLSKSLSTDFDNHISKVKDYVGDPIHDFSHVYINEERALPNNVFLIISGLSPINERIERFNDRVEEINERQKVLDEENAIDNVDLSGLNSKVSSGELTTEVKEINIASIFDQFGVL